MQDFIAEGYSAAQLVSQIHDRIVIMDTIRDKEKSVIAERLGVGCGTALTWVVASVACRLRVCAKFNILA